MTHRLDDDKSEPLGGPPAERLREFIDQRFPGGVPLPEGVSERRGDAKHETEQVKSSQPTEVQLDRPEQTLQQLVETLQRFETRLNRLEQTVQELVEAQKQTGASPESS